MGAIGNGVRSNAARQAVGEWALPAERAKEAKGRRGWEKPEVVAAHRGGGWVCRHLVGVVFAGEAQLQVQVLYALMALERDNPTFCNALKIETDGESRLSLGLLLVLRSGFVQVIHLCKILHSYYDLEMLMFVLRQHIGTSLINHFSAPLMNSLSLTTLIRSQPYHGTRDNGTALAVIHALNNLITTKSESQQIRARACFVLCRCTNISCHCNLTRSLSIFISG
jgi:hypothetical protein